MVSLLDIVPSTKRVPVGEQQVEVRGLSIADIAYLITQYPEVKKLFNGGDVNFSVDDLIEAAPTIVTDIILCGTGNRGDETDRARAVVEGLSVDAQFELLAGIIDVTFKAAGGPGPFVQRLSSLFGESAAGITALASKSPRPPKR